MRLITEEDATETEESRENSAQRVLCEAAYGAAVVSQ
jgi:hypothetical protein